MTTAMFRPDLSGMFKGLWSSPRVIFRMIIEICNICRNRKDRTLFQMSFFIQFFHYLEIISWEWERPPPCWGGGGETRRQTVPPTSCRQGRPARGGSMSCTSPPPPSWRGSHQPARQNIPRRAGGQSQHYTQPETRKIFISNLIFSRNILCL